jgi:hypothetical protein
MWQEEASGELAVPIRADPRDPGTTLKIDELSFICCCYEQSLLLMSVLDRGQSSCTTALFITGFTPLYLPSPAQRLGARRYDASKFGSGYSDRSGITFSVFLSKWPSTRKFGQLVSWKLETNLILATSPRSRQNDISHLSLLLGPQAPN